MLIKLVVLLLLQLLRPGLTQAWTSPVICLSWDGVISDSANWRMEQGIHAALSVWPFLIPDDNDRKQATRMRDDGDGNGDDDHTTAWLRNKVRAIGPHLGGLESCLGAEYALLVRLLLEEQQLDPSVGRTGKYASRFHPQGQKAIAIPSARSSRPLTVGEIQANWLEYILDTLLVKYAINGNNPAPILQQVIDSSSIQPRPKRNSLICEAVQSCAYQVVIVVPRESDLPVVTEMLPSIGVTLTDDLSAKHASCIVVGSERTVVTELCKRHTEVCFVGSNLTSLQQIKELVGIYPHLAVHLVSWASSETQQMQVERVPKVHLLTEGELVECLSARVINQV